jgi:peroxisome-assembly ATPase
MPSLKALLASTVFVTLANAETIRITANSDNRFDPDTITAREGDFLEFFFEGRNHSVVSGNYETPCTPEQIGMGFYSGFFPVDGDDEAVRTKSEANP